MPAALAVYAIFSVIGGLLFGLLYAALRWGEDKAHKEAVNEAGFLVTVLALPIFVIVFMVAYVQAVALGGIL